MRYNRRLPNALTLNRKQQLPAKLTEHKIDAAKLASNGTPSALITCIMYDDQTAIPLVTIITPSTITRMHGFRTRFCDNSLTLPRNVGAVKCWHLSSGSVHKLHAFAAVLCLIRQLNSSRTACADTHPRSHCMDLRASFGRFFDSNHAGVSGTKWIIMIIAMGNVETTIAIWRHVRNDEMANATNTPKFAVTCVSPNRVPLIDFWLEMANKQKKFQRTFCLKVHTANKHGYIT